MPQSNARVTGDFSDLIKGAQSAAKSVADLGLKMSGISTAAKAFDVATSAIGGTMNALAKIGQAAMGIEAIGKSAAAMGMGLLQGNAALEMTTISFQTLLGSASAAQDMIKQLTDFAQKTPFELTGLEANTQRLLAFGFSAKDIIPLMTSMGDAISALGGTQDNLNSLVYVMGQMRQEAHINAGDIMQMVNLGIPALQMLADHYHKTTGEIQEMISKGLIPGNEAVAIFTQSLETKYGGMMAAQSSTFSGMLSNLQDWFSATTIILTKPLFEPAKKALQAFLDFVQSPAGVAVINRMALNIQKAVDSATKAFIQFEPRIRPTLTRLLQVANAVRSQMTPGILTLIPLLGQLWTRVEPLALGFYKVYQAIQPMNIAFAALRGFITGGTIGALDALKTRFSMIQGYVQIGLNAALVEFRKFGPAILAELQKIGPVIFNWIANTAIAIARQAVVWGEALISWAAPYAARLITELINLGGQVLNWIIDYAPVLGNQFLWWGYQIVDWVIPAIPRLLNVLGQFGTNLLQWVEREIPILTTAFFQWTEILIGWVLPAIPGVVAALEQVAAAILNWGIYRLPQVMGQVAISIGKGFGLNLTPIVNDVLVIFYSLVNSIRSTVLPAFQVMLGYLANQGIPILNHLAMFTAGVIIPVFANLAAFTMTTLVPAFLALVDVMGRLFGPSLTLIGSIISNDLLPYLSTLWGVFEQNYLPTVKNLADKFGVDLANGINTAIGKFQDSIPAIDAFITKVTPLAETIWGIYMAFSPVVTIFDVFKGFLEGGTDGAIAAFKDRINGMSKVLGVDLLGVFNTVVNFIKQNVIPVVISLGDWFEAHIIPIIEAVAKTFMNDILPALGRFWDFAVKNILPALGDFFDWFSDKIIPVLGKLVAFVLDTVIPTLTNWWKVIATILQPIIEWLAQFISDTLIPALTDIGKFINEKVLPVVTDMAQTFETKVFPILKVVGDFLGGAFQVAVTVIGKAIEGVGWVVTNVLMPALSGLWTFITNFVLPVLNTVSEIFGNTIRGAITGFGWVVDNLIVPGFNTIKNAVGGVVGFITTAIKTVANFFVDAVNTPLNAINMLIDALKGIDILGAKPFDWLGHIPTLGYLAFAAGTKNAPGGLSLVGEQGAELVKMGQGAAAQLILATQPMLLNLPKGAQVFNNQQTMMMLPNPASASQIHNMYQTSNANRSWDYYSQNSSQVNSNNNTYYVNGQPSNQWDFEQQNRWFGQGSLSEKS